MEPDTDPNPAAGPRGDGAAPGATAPPAEAPFDRERVLGLLDRLERDIGVIESAMVHVEAGDHDAFGVAVAALDAAPTR
jgi:hypothetical protein